jgi:diguanylate cyclase (GGDEF)-like protein
MNLSVWMFGSLDRERMLDMDARLRPTRRKTFGVLAIGLVACAPWAGWWTLAPMAGAILVYGFSDRMVSRFEHPGALFFGTWIVVEFIIAASVSLTGGLREATVCLLAIPVMTLNARFAVRGILVGAGVAAGLMAAVLLSGDPGAVVREPPILIAPLLLVASTAMLSMPLMRSDVEHRKGTRIDTLTGMLNRFALINRVGELSEQSAITGHPVGVIHGDIDRFKAVNDSAGHAAGDAVLTDVAYALRKVVRAYESAYRVGGEEFLILLPGADLDRTAEQAERLRQAVESATFGDGRAVTMSFGVSASREGEVFDFERVFAQADGALYEAKRTGRNRVCTAGGDGPRHESVSPIRVARPAEAA